MLFIYIVNASTTAQQQRPFYGRLSRTTRVSRYQKKHSPTHHPDHHPIFIIFFHLPRSIASSLFKLRAWQSFCTTSFHASVAYYITTITTTSVWRPFFRTTWASRHQKGKPFWILLEQEMMGWQRHQLDHMQVICTLFQTDNHASTLPLSFYRSDAPPAAQPTASKHWRNKW